MTDCYDWLLIVEESHLYLLPDVSVTLLKTGLQASSYKNKCGLWCETLNVV